MRGKKQQVCVMTSSSKSSNFSPVEIAAGKTVTIVNQDCEGKHFIEGCAVLVHEIYRQNGSPPRWAVQFAGDDRTFDRLIYGPDVIHAVYKAAQAATLGRILQ